MFSHSFLLGFGDVLSKLGNLFLKYSHKIASVKSCVICIVKGVIQNNYMVLKPTYIYITVHLLFPDYFNLKAIFCKLFLPKSQILLPRKIAQKSLSHSLYSWCVTEWFKSRFINVYMRRFRQTDILPTGLGYQGPASFTHGFLTNVSDHIPRFMDFSNHGGSENGAPTYAAAQLYPQFPQMWRDGQDLHRHVFFITWALLGECCLNGPSFGVHPEWKKISPERITRMAWRTSASDVFFEVIVIPNFCQWGKNNASELKGLIFDYSLKCNEKL